MTNFINIDRECFEYGSKIYVDTITDKKKNENVIQKALGVLQDDGVFAFSLYLRTLDKEEGKVADSIKTNIFNLAKKVEIPLNKDEDFKTIGSNLNTLLITKELIEKTLIYARYHARAKGDVSG